MTDRTVMTFDEPLPLSTPRRDLPRDDRFDTVVGFEVERVSAAGLHEPRLVSSAHGPIRHVMLWYPGSTKRATYEDLLAKLPPGTRVTLATHPKAAREAEEIAGTSPDRDIEIITTPSYLNFTVWAEDACVVVEDTTSHGPVTYLIEPWSFTRAGDQVVVDLVAQASDAVAAMQVPLYFQGGNVLIGDDFVLIGRDYLDKTIQEVLLRHAPVQGFPRDGSPADMEGFVVDLFRRLLDPSRTFHFLQSTPANRFDRLLAPLGGELWLHEVGMGRGPRQPIFHIDMFVSLAGRAASGSPYRVLVGDPRLADEIMGWPPVPHSLQSEYDEIAAQLAGLGFQVTRSPLPLIEGRHKFKTPQPMRLEDGTVASVAGVVEWYHATSNNCLVQINGDARDVWLPTYGQGDAPELAPLDVRHKEIWEELGFTVHQLGDFHHLARGLGALHCIKKYLAR